jgi:hypothetical protein
VRTQGADVIGCGGSLQASTSSDPEAEAVDQELANSLAAWINTAVAAAGAPMDAVGVVGKALASGTAVKYSQRLLLQVP